MPEAKRVAPIELPIDAHVEAIGAAVRDAGGVVLVAEPGAGKTTRVPVALAQHAEIQGEILVVEPRRLAARMSAARVAEEQGWRLGETVGYTVRFEDKSSPRTRVRFVTEGILLRRLLDDRELRGVGAVVFDEFHERSLDSDLALGWVRALRRTVRPDLRVVVMSATMDPAPVAQFLDVPVRSVPGRAFPVEVEHLDAKDARPLEAQVAGAVRKLLVRGASGDVLVFLPGAGEIRRAMEASADLEAAFGVERVALHGELPPAEQDRAVRPGPKRKVIYSTNIAETSLTLPSVVAVVDSGLARVMRHSPWSGLPRLETTRISQASATQRAGRAGRVGPGHCLRLYTKHDFHLAEPLTVPEIRRADLASTALLLRVHAPEGFAFFEAPPEAAETAAVALLTRLGALDAAGSPTALGRRMLSLPAHPRLARVLVACEERSVAARGALMAAVIEERELRLDARLRFGEKRGGQRETGASDVLARLEAFERVEAEGGGAGACRAHGVDFMAYQAIRNVRGQLARALRVAPDDTGALADEEPALLEALLAGYGDRVGKRRAPRAAEVVFAEGGAGRLDDVSVVRDAELLLAIDVDDLARGGTVVRVASAVEPEWLLELPGVADHADLSFDPKTERVMARRRLMLGQIALDESLRPAEPSEGATAVLRAALHERGIRNVLDLAASDALLGRWRYASGVDSRIPEPTDDVIEAAVLRQTEGATGFLALRAVPVETLLLAELGAERLSLLDRVAPSHATLPGRRVPIQYEPGKPPWMESRLQDFFGLAEGPRVGGGKDAVVLHLLAPNGRAVQVTTDLAGFWSKHYPELRNQLMRRYPRHSWPDDPRHAPAPQRRRQG